MPAAGGIEQVVDPLTARVLEAVAAAMGMDAGAERLVVDFRDGHLRRLNREDHGNGRPELARYDHELAIHLERALGTV